MTIEQMMTKDVITLRQDQSMRDAIVLMQRHKIRHVPVVTGPTLVGILTDRDLKRATPSLLTGIDRTSFDRVLDQSMVEQAMTRNPFTVTPSTLVRDAVKVMVDRKFGALPVVEGGRLVGIVTSTDFLRAFYETLED